MIYRISDQIFIPYFALDIKRKGVHGSVNLTHHNAAINFYTTANLTYHFKPEELVSSQYFLDATGSMWHVCYAIFNDTIFNLTFSRN